MTSTLQGVRHLKHCTSHWLTQTTALPFVFISLNEYQVLKQAEIQNKTGNKSHIVQTFS